MCTLLEISFGALIEVWALSGVVRRRGMRFGAAACEDSGMRSTGTVGLLACGCDWVVDKAAARNICTV
jgi:hypothetical protein